jgi:hypothetical protein
MSTVERLRPPAAGSQTLQYNVYYVYYVYFALEKIFNSSIFLLFTTDEFLNSFGFLTVGNTRNGNFEKYKVQ